jgi:aspartate ammonia-lyase
LHLSNGCKTLADYCVDGITANRDALRASVERSIGIVTALNPYIGYANATEIAAEAHSAVEASPRSCLNATDEPRATGRRAAPGSADQTANDPARAA